MKRSNVPDFNSQGQYKAVEKKNPAANMSVFWNKEGKKPPMIYFTSDVHDKQESIER